MSMTPVLVVELSWSSASPGRQHFGALFSADTHNPLPSQHSCERGMAQGSVIGMDVALPYQPGIVGRPGGCEQKQQSKTVEECRSLLKQ